MGRMSPTWVLPRYNLTDRLDTATCTHTLLSIDVHIRTDHVRYTLRYLHCFSVVSCLHPSDSALNGILGIAFATTEESFKAWFSTGIFLLLSQYFRFKAPILAIFYLPPPNVFFWTHTFLSADDCIIYRQINDESDIAALQNDLNVIETWTTENEMKINVSKSIYLSNKLGWEEQVTNTTRKAWKALHFSMRILKKSNRKSKELAYKTLVRPIMECGAVGWGPYRQNQIDSIEKVQRKAAKYVKMGNGHDEEIVKDLGWELLKSRRRKTRLTALFKAQMGHKAWNDIDARLATPSYLGRTDHIRKFKCRKQRTDVAKFSFVNRSIVDWNSLPAAIFQDGPLEINTFKERLRRLD
ncbi:hypothetical protein ANN_11763 [Periplaneta americana]|uniref:Uncharacterized protein n=1 Tax=Periplaneta americana TaxID=6978 RepID=A0ABQ8T7F6_PERAM|nr:hypothetical protein ANN_11763 [Periplaneta americana]